MLWIRIWVGSDPHNFAGSVSIPSTYIVYFLHDIVNILSNIHKTMTHLPLMRKEKHSKLALLRIKVKFSNMCKTLGKIPRWIGIVLMPIRIRIYSRTASTCKVGSGSSSKRCRSIQHWYQPCDYVVKLSSV
jgi:hypothetical protein